MFFLDTNNLFHYITVFSRLQNDAAVKVDNFMSDGRVFHNDGPATEKLRVLKPTVLVLGTTRSPWPADQRWQRVDTAEIGVSALYVFL